LEKKGSPISRLEYLSEIDFISEALGIGLRMKSGFDTSQISSYLSKIIKRKFGDVELKYPRWIKLKISTVFIS
jgi:hypothetical protein